MHRQLVLEVRRDSLILKVKERARLLAAVDGIEHKKMLRARDDAQKLRTERAAVDDLHGRREVVLLAQEFGGAHAEALVLQDDVADAENRHGGRRLKLFSRTLDLFGRYAQERFTHRAASFFSRTFFRSHESHAGSPSPVRHAIAMTSMPG